MEVVCPKCRQPIAGDDLNVSTDLARCRTCDALYTLSELVADEPPVDLGQPPWGAWHHDDGVSVTIGATTRSPMAFFLVPFMCVWSGLSVGGIYGGQLARGHFDLQLSLFGIPFLAGTVLFGGIALMTVLGKCEVRLGGERGEIFTGVGPLGWRRHFAIDGVTRIEIDHSSGPYSGKGVSECLALRGERTIKFGTMWNDTRRAFVLNALRQHLPVRRRK